MDIILENQVVSKSKFSKNVTNKKCAPKMRFSQNFAIFDDFYSTGLKTWKPFNGMVVGFGPKRKPGRMCNSVL